MCFHPMENSHGFWTKMFHIFLGDGFGRLFQKMGVWESETIPQWIGHVKKAIFIGNMSGKPVDWMNGFWLTRGTMTNQGTMNMS